MITWRTSNRFPARYWLKGKMLAIMYIQKYFADRLLQMFVTE